MAGHWPLPRAPLKGTGRNRNLPGKEADTDNGDDDEQDRQSNCELKQRLFQAAPGSDCGLGATEEAAATLLNLAKDYQDQDNGYQDLCYVKKNQFFPLFPDSQVSR